MGRKREQGYKGDPREFTDTLRSEKGYDTKVKIRTRPSLGPFPQEITPLIVPRNPSIDIYRGDRVYQEKDGDLPAGNQEYLERCTRIFQAALGISGPLEILPIYMVMGYNVVEGLKMNDFAFAIRTDVAVRALQTELTRDRLDEITSSGFEEVSHFSMTKDYGAQPPYSFYNWLVGKNKSKENVPQSCLLERIRIPSHHDSPCTLDFNFPNLRIPTVPTLRGSGEPYQFYLPRNVKDTEQLRMFERLFLTWINMLQT